MKEKLIACCFPVRASGRVSFGSRTALSPLARTEDALEDGNEQLAENKPRRNKSPRNKRGKTRRKNSGCSIQVSALARGGCTRVRFRASSFIPPTGAIVHRSAGVGDKIVFCCWFFCPFFFWLFLARAVIFAFAVTRQPDNGIGDRAITNRARDFYSVRIRSLLPETKPIDRLNPVGLLSFNLGRNVLEWKNDY